MSSSNVQGATHEGRFLRITIQAINSAL